MVASSPKRVAAPRGDRVFYGFLYVLMAVLLVVTGYPVVYILAASFSDRIAVMTGKVLLWPV
nr:carbohydrate ABC transporter permease [Clostridia bacterium]